MSIDDLDTKPAITPLLERINELDESLKKHIDEVAGEIRAEIAALRTDTNKNFRSLERRFAVLSADMIKLRADMHDLEDSARKSSKSPPEIAARHLQI